MKITDGKDVIVFDLGGVLIDLDRERCIEEFRKIGFPQADDLLDPYRQKGIFKELEKGNVGASELYDYVRENSNENPTDEQIKKALVHFLKDIPFYKLDLLLELKKDYTIYMLSNTNDIMFPYIQETFFTSNGKTIDDYFDKLYLSYRMKMLKPDREIYDAMIKDSGLDPRRTLFIDDSDKNTEAAKELGFKTYTPKPEEDFTPLFR